MKKKENKDLGILKGELRSVNKFIKGSLITAVVSAVLICPTTIPTLNARNEIGVKAGYNDYKISAMDEYKNELAKGDISQSQYDDYEKYYNSADAVKEYLFENGYKGELKTYNTLDNLAMGFMISFGILSLASAMFASSMVLSARNLQDSIEELETNQIVASAGGDDKYPDPVVTLKENKEINEEESKEDKENN